MFEKIMYEKYLWFNLWSKKIMFEKHIFEINLWTKKNMFEKNVFESYERKKLCSKKMFFKFITGNKYVRKKCFQNRFMIEKEL